VPNPYELQKQHAEVTLRRTLDDSGGPLSREPATNSDAGLDYLNQRLSYFIVPDPIAALERFMESSVSAASVSVGDRLDFKSEWSISKL